MSISQRTKRLLLAKSGAVCANPSCHRDLFESFENGSLTNIEELAHIIGQSKDGPRGESDLTERDEYDNIVVLCPTCHSLIDKNPNIYTISLIKSWKELHEKKLFQVFSIPLYDNQSIVKNEIEKLLLENENIFETYGPYSEEAKQNPLSDYAKIWHDKTLTIIIPNNRKIKLVLENNLHLFDRDQKKVFEKLKRHFEDFEYNKLSGDKIGNPQMFPKEFNDLISSK